MHWEDVDFLVDFSPRPYNTYRTEETDIKFKTEGEEESNDSIVDHPIENNGKIIIKVEPKNKGFFAWFSSMTAANKLILLKTFIGLAAIVVLTYTYTNQQRWMIWQNDHYIETTFDVEKYDFNQLKLYKPERIEYFKKILPDCKTDFFKKDGTPNLWYGKNAQGQLEYFTSIGLHPETGKTLKAITYYMIKKYVCEDYKR